jgi:hypothetical protein
MNASSIVRKRRKIEMHAVSSRPPSASGAKLARCGSGSCDMMSAMGHLRTSRDWPAMSALPPESGHRRSARGSELNAKRRHRGGGWCASRTAEPSIPGHDDDPGAKIVSRRPFSMTWAQPPPEVSPALPRLFPPICSRLRRPLPRRVA